MERRGGTSATTRYRRFLLRVSRFLSHDWERPHWRILYYHAVPQERRGTFADQLDWFSKQFQWCTISEGADTLSEATCHGPLMSVTFDDADRTVVDVVAPLLEERRIRACVYVVPTYVNRGWSYRDPVPRTIMNWSDLRDWVAAGHEVGSHTYTHALLTRCSPQRIEQEMRWSRQELEQKLGVRVEHFAYPWGQYDLQTENRIRKLGLYATLATTRRGGMDRCSALFRLCRDRADLDKTPEELERTMRLADRLYGLRRLRLLALWHRSSRATEKWEALPCLQKIDVSESCEH